ncbi:MAG: tetratricopeptide repeat protein [Candidatus Latescibacteria bacterium]|nr:hypothetical protein [Gemmatimonadaceae bacterium]MDP6016908.1 tetratricopeptide repeat protein [Candidatus Latescibacterota bacterium]
MTQSLRTALLLGLFALLIRVAYLYEIGDGLFFEIPLVDAKTYVEGALLLPATGWLGPPEPFWQPPLYPYLLAVVFSVFGEGDLLAPRILQALLGACICSLVYLVGRRVFTHAVALGAGVVAALYGPLIYFGGELLPALVGTALNLLLVHLLLLAPVRARRRYLLIGGLLGLSSLAVANVLLFLPFLLLWLWRQNTTEPRRVIRAALVVAGCGLIILPVTARNLFVGGDAVLISSNAGINFFIGNNPDSEQTVSIRPGRQWSELVETPESEAGIERPSAKSQFFFRRSLRFARDDPAGFSGAMLRKLFRFWQGDEPKRNLDLYWARRDSDLLSLLLWRGTGMAFPFGLVAPLALVGLFAYLRQPGGGTPNGRLLAGFLLVYMLSVVLFFVTSRYRLPAVPFLLLFAAYGVHTIARTDRRLRHVTGLAGLIVLCNVGMEPMPARADTQQLYWEGYAYKKKGMPANAVQNFRRVLRQDPNHGGALLGLAEMHDRRQEYSEAADLYERFLRVHPRSDPARYQLAGTLLKTKRFSDAIREYEVILRDRPDWAPLLGQLALANVMEGRHDQALEFYGRTLEIQPDSAVVRYQLARLQGAMGDTVSAMAEFRRLVAQDSSKAEYRIRLAELLVGPVATAGRSLVGDGRTDEAEALLRTAIDLDPVSDEARWSLGLLLARQDQYEAALPHFERLLELNPGDPLVHHCLGNLHSRLGQDGEAQRQFRLAAGARRAGENRRLAESQIRDQVERFLGGP